MQSQVTGVRDIDFAVAIQVVNEVAGPASNRGGGEGEIVAIDATIVVEIAPGCWPAALVVHGWYAPTSRRVQSWFLATPDFLQGKPETARTGV